jgi:hypothetical protein
MGKKVKIQAAIDALKMTTPGDWWADDFNDLRDGVGTFPIARDIGGSTGAQESANRKVIAAARELAEEVVRLRELLTKAGHVVGALQGGVPCEDDIEFIRCSIEGEGL